MTNLESLPGSSPAGARDSVSWSEPSICRRSSQAAENRTAPRATSFEEVYYDPNLFRIEKRRWRCSDPPMARAADRTAGDEAAGRIDSTSPK